MNRPEQIEQLIQEAFPGDRPETGMDERILSDASTAMKQASAAAEQARTVLDWRQIMRSPITRIAAVVALGLGLIWICWQGPETQGGTPTMLSLLNAAAAAENAWFTGEQTVHIVNEIVVHTRADGKDLARMLEELESDYDESKRVAFTRLVLAQRWLPIYSLEPDGDLHLHKLELVDPQAAGAKVKDRIWYDPVSARYARILSRKDYIHFAHAFDGQQVHLAQRNDQGELVLRSVPVSAEFSPPQDPADFLGLAAGVRGILPEEGWAPLEERTQEATTAGKTLRVYKLGFVDPWEKLDTYQLIYVDQQDQSIAKIECIVDQQPTLTIERLTVTQGNVPPAAWDLSALQETANDLDLGVTVQADSARVGLTIQEMVERTSFPVYTFARDPHGTRQREIVDVLDPASPLERMMITLYHTQVEGYVTMIQCRTVTRYVTTSLKNWQERGFDWHPIYTTARGFKLYDLHGLGGIDWVWETIYSQLKVKGAPKQNGYVFASPEGQYVLLGINGWMPSNELEQLADVLIPGEAYVPSDQSLPKITPDLDQVTHAGLEHNSFINRWLVLGRLPLDAYGPDTSNDETRKRAFADDQLDVKAVSAQVNMGDRDHEWTACYGNAIDLGRVYGEDTPGICYAQARISVSQQTDTALGIGSDDAVKVWLNGDLLHDHWVSRNHQLDSDIVPVTLQKGANHLVLKVLNRKSPWRFSCRFKDPQMAPVRTGCMKRPGLAPAMEVEIDRFRTQVQWRLDTDQVPGAALALVDEKGILWAEGFGHTTKNGSLVTPDTPFLAMGLTKLVTASAVLRAVQDGDLNLDIPISSYLPDFHFNSRFEDAPENKITLRHLLSHQSGLPQEAPKGNNYEPVGSFDDRVDSLKGSWMTFPAGVTHDLGSNADFDLAARILQEVSGRPWEQCLQERILNPLGMENSLLCVSDILPSKTPAIGYNQSVSKMPVAIPQLGSHGLYSTVTDLAKLMQVFLNQGKAAGKPFLKPSLLIEMQRPYNYDTDSWEPQFYYGLGMKIQRQSEHERTLLFFQAGSGYGFSARLWWSPELGLGMIALANRDNKSATKLLTPTLRGRLVPAGLVSERFPAPELAFDEAAGVWWDGDKHAKTTPYRQEWAQYCGHYRLKLSGFHFKAWAQNMIDKDPENNIRTVKIFEKDGFLCITENSRWGIMRMVDTRLDEIQPGVFAYRGWTLDFTDETPTWKNYRLEKL